MPTYEYRCKDCGHTFDVYQSFADDALTECPQCAGALRKLFGNVGISFKGSGFYKTDSRAGSGKSRDGASPKETGSTSSTGDSSSNGSGSKSSGSDKSSSDSASTSSSGSSDSKGSKGSKGSGSSGGSGTKSTSTPG